MLERVKLYFLCFREMCRSETWAFEDYKNTKIEAAKVVSEILL